MILLLAISKQFGSHPSDVPFCLFAQTFVFVAYNKVVTSQYFLWYLSLLPLVFPARIRMTKSEMATVLLLWGFTQARLNSNLAGSVFTHCPQRHS